MAPTKGQQALRPTDIMLRSIQVRDFAIVDDLSLELGPGMTVLSGETGAGKSLIVDALNLAVGERASADAIRTGASRAEVNAEFDPDETASAWLAAHDLSEDDMSCVLRRVVSRDGRSRAYINARPVPVSQLRALGELLLDVHGQHAHQSLLRPAAQRAALDAFAGHDDMLNAVGVAFQELRAARAEVRMLTGADSQEDRAGYLRYQLDELEAWVNDGSDPTALIAEHRRLAHAGEVLDALAAAARALGDGGAEGHLQQALNDLDAAARYDATIADEKAMLIDAQTLLSEASRALSRRVENADSDPQRLGELERCITQLQDLARKHRTAIESLPDTVIELRDELERLANNEAALADARARSSDAEARYRHVASDLSTRRHAAARAFSDAIEEVLKELGMAHTRVTFAVDSHHDAEPSAHGSDRVELKVATNPGQPVAPIARIASGGELSRIALAIQNATSGRLGVATLVFDEVDAGVGGAVAEVLGGRMRALGESHQVLAVTHLPQVAAQAHHQVRVHKVSGGTRARTQVEVLDAEARVAEVARMLGGVELTERSVAHAREMLERGMRKPKSRRRRGAGGAQ